MKKLITLTPVGSYYFGGEHSFTVGKKEDDNNDLASYIVESNLFPQQTSLLGMLRFWILRNDELAFNLATNRIANEQRANELIGKSSFCANEERNFGKIKGLGVCFLQKNGKAVLPTPLDYGLNVDFSKSQTAFYNGKEKTLPEISNYEAKKGLTKGFINESGKFISQDEIFLKDQRIGINRDITTGKTEDGALYKQIFYRLADGFRFAFEAEFEDGYQLPANGQIVELGGDASKFILNYEDNASEITYNAELSKSPAGFTKVILLSDTHLLNEKDNSDFSITENVPFRFLKFQTTADTKYARTSKNDKSERYSLFKRGSVFYFKEQQKLTEFQKAANNKIFTIIGYNQLNIK